MIGYAMLWTAIGLFLLWAMWDNMLVFMANKGTTAVTGAAVIFVVLWPAFLVLAFGLAVVKAWVEWGKVSRH